jgi:site-specific DNA recombinase
MTAVREARLRSSVKWTKARTTRGGRPVCAGLATSFYPTRSTWGRSVDTTGRIRASTNRLLRARLGRRRRSLPQRESARRLIPRRLSNPCRPPVGRSRPSHASGNRLAQGHGLLCHASSNALCSQVEYRRAYRSNAARLDSLVIAGLANLFADRKTLRSALKGLGHYRDELDRLVLPGSDAAGRLEATPRALLAALFGAGEADRGG